jgi:hypothetical protein
MCFAQTLYANYSNSYSLSNMGRNVKTLIKIFFIIVIVELCLFFIMLGFIMTDESINSTGRFVYSLFKYCGGFPLVLINNEYPFFLESKEAPNYFILLIFFNILIQSLIVYILRKLLSNFAISLRSIRKSNNSGNNN